MQNPEDRRQRRSTLMARELERLDIEVLLAEQDSLSEDGAG